MKLANRVLTLFFILGFISVFLTLQVRAELNLGDIYENFLVTKSKAEQGDAGAQSVLGIMYYNGEGVPQDYKKALHWFTKPAEQGNVTAQSFLGIMYYNGEGVPKDYKKALHWFTKPAEQGDVTAQSFLGIMYYDGKGVSQDYKKALHWFTKAAEQGDATSKYNREILLKQMTSSQIEEGQKLSKEL